MVGRGGWVVLARHFGLKKDGIFPKTTDISPVFWNRSEALVLALEWFGGGGGRRVDNMSLALWGHNVDGCYDI